MTLTYFLGAVFLLGSRKTKHAARKTGSGSQIRLSQASQGHTRAPKSSHYSADIRYWLSASYERMKYVQGNTKTYVTEVTHVRTDGSCTEKEASVGHLAVKISAKSCNNLPLVPIKFSEFDGEDSSTDSSQSKRLIDTKS